MPSWSSVFHITPSFGLSLKSAKLGTKHQNWGTLLSYVILLGSLQLSLNLKWSLNCQFQITQFQIANCQFYFIFKNVTWNALWHASVTNSMDCLWVGANFLAWPCHGMVGNGKAKGFYWLGLHKLKGLQVYG